MAIAAKYPEIEEFDKSDIGSYLRWQYGIYASWGMSYEEFWQKDYLLVESYIKKHEMDIERETAFNWELTNLIRAGLLEIVTNIYRDKKSGKKPFKFPKKPEPRTARGQAREQRNKSITAEIREYFNQKVASRKEGSNGK